MKLPGDLNYYVYLTSNASRTVLYTGMTNDLRKRLKQHFDQSGNTKTFVGRYYCYHLVYYEWFPHASSAIRREKEIKGWTRAKKNALVETVNPNWKFISEPFFEDQLGSFCGNM